jgi:hypothetical protein
MPDVNYAYGWSKGKERFKGKPDNGKGSFYANPLKEENEIKVGDTVFQKNNVWPTEDIPEL